MDFDQIQKIRYSAKMNRKLRSIMSREGGWTREAMMARINAEETMVPLQKYGAGPFKEYDVLFDPLSNCYVMKDIELTAKHPADPEREDFELTDEILADLYESTIATEEVRKYIPAKETHEGTVRKGFIRNPKIQESEFTLSGEKFVEPTLYSDLYVSPDVYEKIADGELPGRSVEIRKNARTGKWYIDSVALLSAEEPYFSFPDLSGPKPDSVPEFQYQKTLTDQNTDALICYSRWPSTEKTMKDKEEYKGQECEKPEDEKEKEEYQESHKDEEMSAETESVEGDQIEMAEGEKEAPKEDIEEVVMEAESEEHEEAEMGLLHTLTQQVRELSALVGTLIKKDEAVHEEIEKDDYVSDVSSITANPVAGPPNEEALKAYEKDQPEEVTEEVTEEVEEKPEESEEKPEAQEYEKEVAEEVEETPEVPDVEALAKEMAEEANKKAEEEANNDKLIELNLEKQILRFKKANKDLPNVLADLKKDYMTYAKQYGEEVATNFADSLYKHVTPYPTKDAGLQKDEVEMYNKTGTDLKDAILQQYSKDFGSDAVFQAKESWEADKDKLEKQFGSKERFFELYMKNYQRMSGSR